MPRSTVSAHRAVSQAENGRGTSLCLGVHVSIAGKLSRAIDRARTLQCGTMQIFSRSPRGWKAAAFDPEEVRRFREERRIAGIRPLAVHASYLINLASSDQVLWDRSLDAVGEELTRADQLDADFLVVHVGSNAVQGTDYATTRMVEALKRVRTFKTRTRLLLENTAGERGDLGSRMEELAAICDRLGPDSQIGFCLDTCHAFAAGYDLSRPEGVRQWVRTIESTIGLDRLCLLHVNDSKKGLSCHVDRHEHIGKGKIGLKGFETIVRHPRLRNIPMILETPKKQPGDDRQNMDVLIGLARQS